MSLYAELGPELSSALRYRAGKPQRPSKQLLLQRLLLKLSDSEAASTVRVCDLT